MLCRIRFSGGGKLAARVIALFLFSGIALAQVSPMFSFTASDNSCNNFPNSCQLDHGCTRTTFTMTASGTFYLKAWVGCTANDCRHCAACVKLFPHGGQTPIASCSTNSPEFCGSAVCCRACTIPVELVADTDYDLEVCLVFCAREENCDLCAHDCTAFGEVSGDGNCP